MQSSWPIYPLKITAKCLTLLISFSLFVGCDRPKSAPKTAEFSPAQAEEIRKDKAEAQISFPKNRTKFFLPDKVLVETPAIEINESVPPNLPAPELFAHTKKIAQKIAKSPNIEQKDMKPYFISTPKEFSPKLEMIPISGGKFILGSPENELGHKEDEILKPVEISPFWMTKIEIPWGIYRKFMENNRARSKDGKLLEKHPKDQLWDATTQPTAPYTSMTLGMGNGYEDDFPAIAMSRHAANKFCEWLSAQTGEFYRLPTEAEWEFACRAATQTPWSFGNSQNLLNRFAWFYDNSNDQYQRTGRKSPNAFGLHDMHGNVAEWVLDHYSEDARASWENEIQNPLVLFPGSNKPGLVKGGSWDDDPEATRSASRRKYSDSWNARDPQNPKSIWYLTDAPFVGFRIVRPLNKPSAEEMHKIWNS